MVGQRLSLNILPEPVVAGWLTTYNVWRYEMKGCRPLTKDEIKAVSDEFTGTYEARNKALFVIGVNTGGRISELLALTIDDVWQIDRPVSDLLYSKNIVKGKKHSRMIPVNTDGQKAIEELIGWHLEQYGDLVGSRKLFQSRQGGAIGRTQAHRILKEAFEKAGINGKLATHTLRKTYAQNLYDASDDIYLVKEALGHKSVVTTQAYLGVNYEKFRKASENIELNRTMKTLHSINELSDNDLIVEMQKRGFDTDDLIAQLRDDDKVIPFRQVKTGKVKTGTGG